MTPGAIAYVRRSDKDMPKGSNVRQIGRKVIARAIRAEGKTMVWQPVDSHKASSQFRCYRNAEIIKLPVGQCGLHAMGIQRGELPTCCLPKSGAAEHSLKTARYVVELHMLDRPQGDDVVARPAEYTSSGMIITDGAGRIWERTGKHGALVPTSSMIRVENTKSTKPVSVIDPRDSVSRRTQHVRHRPDYFTGRSVYRAFPGSNSVVAGVYRGVVGKPDRDAQTDKNIWSVMYGDGFKTDYDEQEMLKYGVLFVDGDDVTGGGLTLEHKIAEGMPDPRVPGDECAASGDDHAARGDDDHVTPSGDDGDAAAMQAMHAGHPRIDTDQRYFTADEGSTWHDICLQAGMRTEEEQRSYLAAEKQKGVSRNRRSAGSAGPP